MVESCRTHAADVLKGIREQGKVDDALREKLVTLLTNFKDVFQIEEN